MANKRYANGRKRDDLASTVAKIHKVSPGYVRKVRLGDRQNEAIMTTLMEILEGRTALLQAVQKVVPISTNRRNHGTGKENE